MGEYVGSDVSKRETAFCVMDATGKVLARGKWWRAIRRRCSRI